MDSTPKADEFVREDQVCTWLGVSEKQVTTLRQAGLPVISLGKKTRVYHLPSVAQWLLSRQKILGQRSK